MKVLGGEGIPKLNHPEKVLCATSVVLSPQQDSLKLISAFSVALILGKANFVGRWPQIKWPFAVLIASYSVLFSSTATYAVRLKTAKKYHLFCKLRLTDI